MPSDDANHPGRRASDRAAEPQDRGSDRRRAPRRRVIKRAMIVFQRGHCTMRCQVLEVSDTGALLMPADPVLCPREFVLKPDVGDSRNCEIVWRKETKIAVRFV